MIRFYLKYVSNKRRLVVWLINVTNSSISYKLSLYHDQILIIMCDISTEIETETSYPKGRHFTLGVGVLP